MNKSQDWVNQLVREAAQQAGGTLSFDDALRAGTNVGLTEAQLLNAISTGVITDYGDYVRGAAEAPSIENVWQTEMGVSPADIDYALSLAHLKAGGSLSSGQKFLNDSDQGQAYDKYLKSFPASMTSQLNSGAKVDQFKTPTLDFDIAQVQAPSMGTSERQIVGASDGSLMGAGDADYNSSLIKSLRQSSLTPFSTNTGVLMTPNQGASTSSFGSSMDQMGGAFSPQVLNPRTASNQEVSDWNAYSTYRTNALNAKTPILSMAEWLAGGKTDGKAPTVTTPTPDSTVYDYGA